VDSVSVAADTFLQKISEACNDPRIPSEFSQNLKLSVEVVLGMDLTHPQSPSNKRPNPVSRVSISSEADVQGFDLTKECF